MTIAEWNRQQDKAFFGFNRRADRQVKATVAKTRAVSALKVQTISKKTGLPVGLVQESMDRHPELSPIGQGRYDWNPVQPADTQECDPLDFSCLI